MPTYSYKKHEDGRPSEVSLLHVDFARISVEYLRRKPEAIMKDLIAHFNASESSRRHCEAAVTRGNRGTGRADRFFNNGYFKMQDLKHIFYRRAPLLIPLLVDSEGREYSQYEADGDAGHG